MLSFRSRSLLLAPALLLFCLNAFATLPTSGFRPHDRWAVVGDSITHYGTYPAWVYLYYATRQPDLDLAVVNGAISGDSARGTVLRYDWDIKPARPTVTTVMLGMNDVDRDAYAEGPVTAEAATRRQNALADYRANLEKLVRLLKQDGVRVVLVTPSPFDESPHIDYPRLPGVNTALADCARFMRELADREGAALIDLHGQMTALNQRLQAKDPAFTLIGRDRVHPDAAGHLVMAYFFLRGQEAPSLVSRVTLDLETRRIEAKRATVRNLSLHDGRVEFECQEAALPYPVPDAARPALAWVPFEQDFNQELLQVSGLAAGRYALTIDGEPVAELPAQHLASGVNLAELPSTPQLRQAREVLALVQEWQQVVAYEQRGIAEVEHWKLRQLPHPVRFDVAEPLLRQELERMKVEPGPYDDLNRTNINRYFTTKPRETAILDRVKDLEARIRKAARSRPHVYRIVPIGLQGISEPDHAPSTKQLP